MTEQEASLVLVSVVAILAGTVATLALLSRLRLGRRMRVMRQRRLLGLSARMGIRATYSHDAKEQMARLGVSPEHVETVLELPASVARRTMASSVRLRRDFGSRTLTVWVGEPWPSIGPFYVRKVDWRPLGGHRGPSQTLGSSSWR